MQNLIKEEKDGVTTLYMEAIIKEWNSYFSLYHGKDKYVLVKFEEDKDEVEEAIISEVQAKQIIERLNLLSVVHATNKELLVYETEDAIRNKISGMYRLIGEKKKEIEEIERAQGLLLKAIKNREIEEQSEFDAWKEAKKKLSSPFDSDIYGISKEYIDKLKKLDPNFWKTSIKGDLSYYEEYLAIMQYHFITGVNAEMARSHGKGSFGYWTRGITEEEHELMQKVEWNNFKKHLEETGFDEYESFEGISQDGCGGWYFEETEDK